MNSHSSISGRFFAHSSSGVLMLWMWVGWMFHAQAQWSVGSQLGLTYREAGRTGFTQGIPTYGNYDQRRLGVVPSLQISYELRASWQLGLRLRQRWQLVRHSHNARYRASFLSPLLFVRHEQPLGALHWVAEGSAGGGTYRERYWDPGQERFALLKRGPFGILGAATGLGIPFSDHWKLCGLLQFYYLSGRATLQTITADTETFYDYELTPLVELSYAW